MMKAKDLIKLLQTINPESEVVTPGFDETYAASDFKLDECYIRFNTQKGTPHFAPHEADTKNWDLDPDFKFNGYLLDGSW